MPQTESLLVSSVANKPLAHTPSCAKSFSEQQKQNVILIVDDMPANLGVLSNFLHSHNFKVLIAKNGEAAVKKADRAQPDIILLDVMMPIMDGFEACQVLKSQESTKDIPVIFMTALADTVDKVKGFELGAADYITKPIQQEEVLARINSHLNLRKLQLELEARNVELEKRNMEQREARRIAEAANHAKSAFLATMSHELRTPLNAILGYTDMLREDAVDMGLDKIVPDLNKIGTAGEQLLRLINDVLDIARIESGKMAIRLTVFSVTNVLREVETLFRPMLAIHKNHLLVDIAPHLDMIQSDENKLRQIVLNLLCNAAKFTLEGQITLKAIHDLSEQALLIEVHDTGIGIPAEKINTIFQPFTQVDSSYTREYGGSGLGLAICEHYCHLLGGCITVESHVNRGSVFRVQLPMLPLEKV